MIEINKFVRNEEVLSKRGGFAGGYILITIGKCVRPERPAPGAEDVGEMGGGVRRKDD